MSLEDRIKRLEQVLLEKTEAIRLEDGSIVRLPGDPVLDGFIAIMTNLKREARGEPLVAVPYADVLRRAVATDRSGTIVDFVMGMLNRESNNE